MNATSSAMPAHTAAPWPRFEAESASYDRRWRVAVAVTLGLLVACGQAERAQVRPGRAEYEQHRADVAELAGVARMCLLRSPAWCPNGVYRKWLTGRAVRWDEVVAELGGEQGEVRHG